MLGKHRQSESKNEKESCEHSMIPAAVLKYRRRPIGTVINDDQTNLDGLIVCKIGDKLHGNRYEVLELAGQGTFGTVLDVYDHKRKARIALKVIRDIAQYASAAYIEVDVLERIRIADPEKKFGCVRLHSVFRMKHNNREHMCLGFQSLGINLYEVLKKHKFCGFAVSTLRWFAYQLLASVAWCHSISLIHTDLKPENILLLTNESSSDIRLIDFGAATFQNDQHSTLINTRQYRGPEVILGLGWSYPSDLWSVGCILAELNTGRQLFSTHEDMEHLALMERILNRSLPDQMCQEKEKPNGSKYIGKFGLRWPELASSDKSIS